MKNTNYAINLTKLENLANALAECGIESSIILDEENQTMAVTADIWNCCDGSNVEFCVYSAEFEDGFEELHAYCDPKSQSDALFASLFEEN